jgi:hypothetical protein
MVTPLPPVKAVKKQSTAAAMAVPPTPLPNKAVNSARGGPPRRSAQEQAGQREQGRRAARD